MSKPVHVSRIALDPKIEGANRTASRELWATVSRKVDASYRRDVCFDHEEFAALIASYHDYPSDDLFFSLTENAAA